MGVSWRWDDYCLYIHIFLLMFMSSHSRLTVGSRHTLVTTSISTLLTYYTSRLIGSLSLRVRHFIKVDQFPTPRLRTEGILCFLDLSKSLSVTSKGQLHLFSKHKHRHTYVHTYTRIHVRSNRCTNISVKTENLRFHWRTSLSLRGVLNQILVGLRKK